LICRATSACCSPRCAAAAEYAARAREARHQRSTELREPYGAFRQVSPGASRGASARRGLRRRAESRRARAREGRGGGRAAPTVVCWPPEGGKLPERSGHRELGHVGPWRGPSRGECAARCGGKSSESCAMRAELGFPRKPRTRVRTYEGLGQPQRKRGHMQRVVGSGALR